MLYSTAPSHVPVKATVSTASLPIFIRDEDEDGSDQAAKRMRVDDDYSGRSSRGMLMLI